MWRLPVRPYFSDSCGALHNIQSFGLVVLLASSSSFVAQSQALHWYHMYVLGMQLVFYPSSSFPWFLHLYHPPGLTIYS